MTQYYLQRFCIYPLFNEIYMIGKTTLTTFTLELAEKNRDQSAYRIPITLQTPFKNEYKYRNI